MFVCLDKIFGLGRVIRHLNVGEEGRGRESKEMAFNGDKSTSVKSFFW